MEYIAITKALGLFILIVSIGFLFHLSHYERIHPSGFILGGILPTLCLIINIPTEDIQCQY